MRIALAQIGPVVGDVPGNASRIRDMIGRAAAMGADLVVLPELALAGYPLRDLLERPALAERCAGALEDLARVTANGPAVIVGLPERNSSGAGKPMHNVVALLAGGVVAARYRKKLLPSYDVFEEDRWFEPGTDAGLFEIGGARIGVVVCEDAWGGRPPVGSRYACNPVADVAGMGATLLLNPSASPWTVGKPRYREQLFASVARETGLPVLFVNQVCANDELIFDGGSLAIDASGSTCARAPLFEESILVVDVDAAGRLQGPRATWPAIREEEISQALVLGIGHYVSRCGFDRVLLGLSGGIDSALVACLASAAVGPSNVTALAMPSRFSSEGSISDAMALARTLGIRLEVVGIEPVFRAFLDTLAPFFGNLPFGLAEENLQARIRGTLLMAFSNKLGGLVLATGNKSELAVGYSTLYGDMVGALAPIGDLLKQDVYALARHLNGSGDIIPGAILSKPPSAELRPDQKDEDSLPPYPELDGILERYVERQTSIESMVLAGSSPATVRRVLGLVRAAEYKRSQAPVVLKVTARAFGPGRRYPIAQGFHE